MSLNNYKNRRFAIIIGINDYKDKKLDCCVNDAIHIKKELMNRCNFKEKDIYLIISDLDKPLNIHKAYLKAIQKIENEIKKDESTILFYFAGHGKNMVGKPFLLFHDTPYQLEKIYFDISKINPTFQFYVLDSCCSGGKILNKPLDNVREIEKHISNSLGEMFIYACQLDEIANESLKDKHGLLTYYFLEALNNEYLYNEEGTLTFMRIQEYVAKNIREISNFKQNPVIENRIIRFYPFAFLNKMH